MAVAEPHEGAVQSRPSVGGMLAVLLFAGLTLFAVATIVYRHVRGSSERYKANTVVMQQIAFHPKTLIVRKGTEVVFDNKDVAPHNVEATTPHVDSGLIAPGKSFRLVVQEPFDYRCTIHPGMDAKIVLAG